MGALPANSRPHMTAEEIRAFIDTHHWTFAKTMPEWPHEYTLRKNADQAQFEAFVLHIRERGYQRRFKRKQLTYFDFDGRQYWTMGAPLEKTILINRAKLGDPGTEGDID